MDSKQRDYMETNRRRWDELVPLHVASKFYDVDGFKAGRDTLMSLESSEVGDVANKTMLHLQCHFGMDTLSWARRGALVTGVDYSQPAIEQARALAAELGIEARFIESNVYDLPEMLDETYDIVFCSYGVLYWLPDLGEWAKVVARFLKPGGFFYIIDGHPMAGALADDATAENLRLFYPYLGVEPVHYEESWSYADTSRETSNKDEYGFFQSLGEIVTALIDAGLRLEFLHEFPYAGWQRLPSMVKGDDGYWRVPDDDKRIAFLFSLRAGKPA